MKTRKLILVTLIAAVLSLILPSCGSSRSYWGIENEYGYAGDSYGPDYGHYKRNPDHKHHKHHKHYKKNPDHKHKKCKKHKHNPDRHSRDKRNPDRHH